MVVTLLSHARLVILVSFEVVGDFVGSWEVCSQIYAGGYRSLACLL